MTSKCIHNTHYLTHTLSLFLFRSSSSSHTHTQNIFPHPTNKQNNTKHGLQTVFFFAQHIKHTNLVFLLLLSIERNIFRYVLWGLRKSRRSKPRVQQRQHTTIREKCTGAEGNEWGVRATHTHTERDVQRRTLRHWWKHCTAH